jgi:hypothetical protein
MNATVKTRLVTASIAVAMMTTTACSQATAAVRSASDHGLKKVHDPGRVTGTIHGHCSYRDEYQTLAWWCPDYETQLDPGFRSSELSRTPRGRVCAGSCHETLWQVHRMAEGNPDRSSRHDSRADRGVLHRLLIASGTAFRGNPGT